MRKASRPYVSDIRTQAADATRSRVLHTQKTLFAARGIDRATIDQIARKAKVSVSTSLALYKSKEGILRELKEVGALRAALSGGDYKVEG